MSSSVLLPPFAYQNVRALWVLNSDVSQVKEPPFTYQTKDVAWVLNMPTVDSSFLQRIVDLETKTTALIADVGTLNSDVLTLSAQNYYWKESYNDNDFLYSGLASREFSFNKLNKTTPYDMVVSTLDTNYWKHEYNFACVYKTASSISPVHIDYVNLFTVGRRLPIVNYTDINYVSYGRDDILGNPKSSVFVNGVLRSELSSSMFSIKNSDNFYKIPTLTNNVNSCTTPVPLMEVLVYYMQPLLDNSLNSSRFSKYIGSLRYRSNKYLENTGSRQFVAAEIIDMSTLFSKYPKQFVLWVECKGHFCCCDPNTRYSVSSRLQWQVWIKNTTVVYITPPLNNQDGNYWRNLETIMSPDVIYTAGSNILTLGFYRANGYNYRGDFDWKFTLLNADDTQ